MINLLSEPAKREIRAARLNMALLGYATLILGAIVFLVLVFGVGYFITSSERAAAQAELDASREEATRYQQIQQQAEVFSKNLSTAKTITSSEITYSSLLTNMADSLPSGVILSTMLLDNTALKSGKPLTLDAQAKNYNAALLLKSSLEASDLFDKVNIVNISEKPNAPNQPAPAYPLVVHVNASINKATLLKLRDDQ